MGRPKLNNPFKVAKQRYNYTKSRQLSKGWDFAFEDWYKLFLEAGVDKNAPRKSITSRNSLCLVRRDESEPYSLHNCYLATHGQTDNPDYECYRAGKERPQTWVIKDPEQHRKYLPWLRARAQANYRGEKWTLTFKQFNDLWGSLWDLRGRSSTDYCMTRRDSRRPWNAKNSIIVTRAESLAIARERERTEGIIIRRRGPSKKKNG
jgi:hypothetical protein